MTSMLSRDDRCELNRDVVTGSGQSELRERDKLPGHFADCSAAHELSPGLRQVCLPSPNPSGIDLFVLEVEVASRLIGAECRIEPSTTGDELGWTTAGP